MSLYALHLCKLTCKKHWNPGSQVLRFSLAAVLAVIEMADRPFATFGFSQAWFIRGEDPLASPDDYDLEPGSTEIMPLFQEKQEKKHEEHDKAEKKQKRKRKTLTKRNPYEKHHRNL